MSIAALVSESLAERSRRKDIASRRLPGFVRTAATGPPTVHFLSPVPVKPSGGVRVIHRQVDMLNALGWQAQVVYPVPGRSDWFEHSTRTAPPGSLAVADQDVVVVPEFFTVHLSQLPDWCRTVMFNQGAYHTFDLVDRDNLRGRGLYDDLPHLAGILTVSQDSKNLLEHTFPGIPVHITRPVVDSSRFHPGSEPGRRFAYFPSRRTAEQHQLLHVLRERGFDWEPVPISGMSETEVADTLRSCALFLSFSDADGFGLPPAEAMASGCYVVGYAGGGGTEFFHRDFCHPVSSLLEFAVAVEQAAARPMADLVDAGRRAATYIRQTYSEDGLAADLQSFWTPILGAPA
jgi:hypothetical protein